MVRLFKLKPILYVKTKQTILFSDPFKIVFLINLMHYIECFSI